MLEDLTLRILPRSCCHVGWSNLSLPAAASPAAVSKQISTHPMRDASMNHRMIGQGMHVSGSKKRIELAEMTDRVFDGSQRAVR